MQKFWCISVGALLFSLSGCATMFQGTEQSVTLVPSGSSMVEAECNLTNEEGTYHGELNTTVSVHRDGEPLTITCQGDRYKGVVSVDPTFEGEYLVLDLLLDWCIISCIVDGVNNSFYSYPSTIFVPIKTTVSKRMD